MNDIAKHWIDGECVGSDTVAESVNPATGAVLGRWADGGEAQARAAIAAARRARADNAPEHSKSLESSSDRYPGSMTDGAHQEAAQPPVKWLTAAEVDSWLSVVRMMTWLPWSIDQQLRRDSNLGMVEYQVMARLSQSPERTLRMSSLADLANASLSRLSHLVKRLEERGLVRREPDPADGRFTNAILAADRIMSHIDTSAIN